MGRLEMAGGGIPQKNGGGVSPIFPNLGGGITRFQIFLGGSKLAKKPDIFGKNPEKTRFFGK